MKRKITVVALVLLWLCSGCVAMQGKKGGPCIVSRIYVKQQGCHACNYWIYESPKKMHLVLNGLRSLGQRYSSDTDPETMATQSFTIVIHYADGSTKTHQIKADRYIRTGHGPWQQTDPKGIEALNSLLTQLPGDVMLENEPASVV